MSLRRAVLLGLVVPLVSVCSGWATRADPIDSAQPGTAGWLRDTARLPDPTAAADDVARTLATVPAAERTRLAARHPAVVGNLDGAPPAMRFAANERRITTTGRSTGLPWPDAKTLAYDPRGRGTVVEVLGDLATADRIAVVVPGNDTDLSHLDGPGQLRDLAYGLRTGVAQTGPGARVAVVAWAGYRAPGGLGMDALRADLARGGADRLVRFLAGLRAYRPDVPVSLFCHSYGSLVCRFAAPRVHVTGPVTDPVTDIVALGSPGMRADTAAALRTSARVWVAMAAGDWVGTVPHVEVLGLGHGPSPVSAEFGARVVDTGDATGHLDYLRPGTLSLRNLARIAVGDYAHVTCVGGRGCGDVTN
ncbi:MAG TPA: alpha/beta hydrolase [Planosporangium sp.]|jgi:hypothetical protein|nr:alpha/beta hydrolase [Planosporangium sp.]